MIDKSFVDAIQTLAIAADPVKVIDIDGRKYTDKGIIPVKEAEPKPISVDTLTAVKDYVLGNVDSLELTKTLIVIDSPDKVSVLSSLRGDFAQRFCFLVAEWPGIKFPFGSYQSVEQFIIGLQSDFLRRNDVETILRVVGNVQDGVVRQFNDDGVTQQATVKTGVTKVEAIAVPNPVLLAPYRTFPEVDQPPSNFIFRMRSGEQSPTCALFEADGGRWRTEAVANIKEWLTANISEVAILA